MKAERWSAWLLAMEEIGRGGVAEKVGGEKKRWERKRKNQLHALP